MPKEDHNSSDRLHQGLPQGGVELSLDELAKGLANGTISRRKALRVFGGLLASGMLAFILGVAWAQDGATAPASDAAIERSARARRPRREGQRGASASAREHAQGNALSPAKTSRSVRWSLTYALRFVVL
jgi:hypothetical protein